MTDRPHHLDSGDNTSGDSDRQPTGGAPPRAVALAIIAAIVIVAVLVVLHLTGVLGPG